MIEVSEGRFWSQAFSTVCNAVIRLVASPDGFDDLDELPESEQASLHLCASVCICVHLYVTHTISL